MRCQKASPALSYAEKIWKNIGLKGRQIISLPGAPTCLGPALLVGLYAHSIIGMIFE